MNFKKSVSSLISCFFYIVTFAQCDTTLRLKASGFNYNLVEWYVNNQFYSFDSEVVIPLTGSSNTVTLIAYNDNCEMKVSRVFKIDPCDTCNIWIPNATTERNEWTPKSLCEFKFDIYNRWGEHIYSGPPPWSAPVQNDVYVSVVWFKGRRYVGKVTVVR